MIKMCLSKESDLSKAWLRSTVTQQRTISSPSTLTLTLALRQQDGHHCVVQKKSMDRPVD